MFSVRRLQWKLYLKIMETKYNWGLSYIGVPWLCSAQCFKGCALRRAYWSWAICSCVMTVILNSCAIFFLGDSSSCLSWCRLVEGYLLGLPRVRGLWQLPPSFESCERGPSVDGERKLCVLDLDFLFPGCSICHHVHYSSCLLIAMIDLNFSRDCNRTFILILLHSSKEHVLSLE